MLKFSIILIILQSLISIECSHQYNLKILKSIGGTLTPVSSVIEEKAGTNFSLYCDIVSSETTTNNNNHNTVKIPNNSDVNFWREHEFHDYINNKSKRFYSIFTKQKNNVGGNNNNNNINNTNSRGVRLLFNPLQSNDGGKYICVSFFYDLYKTIEIIVNDEYDDYFEKHLKQHLQDNLYCTGQMFECTNGLCIISRYICDGQNDCPDGSDETHELCNGDPCQDKIPCDDGRCIPTSWCCDRHHDPNCTVTHRPKCCQILSESYEELEYGSATVTHMHHGARYLFISVCILSVLFAVVLLLLVLSRVVFFAKKSNLPSTTTSRTIHRDVGNSRNIETIALHHNTRNLLNHCDFVTYHIDNNQQINTNNNSNNSDCEVSEPLLFPIEFNQNIDRSDEQPPPYIDAIKIGQVLNLNEPPPPYTSREMLNVDEN